MDAHLSPEDQLKVMVQLMGGEIKRGQFFKHLIIMPSPCIMPDDNQTELTRGKPLTGFFYFTTAQALAALQLCKPS